MNKTCGILALRFSRVYVQNSLFARVIVTLFFLNNVSILFQLLSTENGTMELRPTGRNVSSERRTRLLDELILNISNPRNAERLRIIQVVENQLDALQEEVRAEVESRLELSRRKTASTRIKSRY